MQEKHIRSILKSFSWRALATLTTFIISYFVTGNLHYAASIGVAELIFKIGLYYIHERVWQRLSLMSDVSY